MAQELGTEEAKEMRFLVSQPPGKGTRNLDFNPSQGHARGHVFFSIGDWKYEGKWDAKGGFLGDFISQLGGHVFFSIGGFVLFVFFVWGLRDDHRHICL